MKYQANQGYPCDITPCQCGMMAPHNFQTIKNIELSAPLVSSSWKIAKLEIETCVYYISWFLVWTKFLSPRFLMIQIFPLGLSKFQ